MTLDPSVLGQALAPLFAPGSMPSGDAVLAWTTAYVKYAQSAQAGIVSLASPLVPIGGGGGPFFPALDAALQAMWAAAVWIGPSATGGPAVAVPLLPLILPVSVGLAAVSDPQVAVSAFRDVLHSYTTLVTVPVVPASGTPAVFPLV